jgi:hypothetical protein
VPVLAWRSDVDGYAFSNTWTFDATERATLAALAPLVVPAAVAAVSVVIPDPIMLAVMSAALAPAAQAYLALGPLDTYGLCGGMAYSTLDHWWAKRPLPRGANAGDRPARTGGAPTTLRDLLWGRLIDSLLPGGVLQRTLEWSLLLNNVPPFLGGGAGALRDWSELEWRAIKAHIDLGSPWPISLVYTGRSVWNQHQVLAYGYTDPGDGTGTLFVYDSNAPHQTGDPSGSVITLDFTGNALVATSPSDQADMLAGFFCSGYTRAAPPPDLAARYGQFVTWSGDSSTWMVADGAPLPVADAAELAELGASAADVRATGTRRPSPIAPRDGALLRERSAEPVYLYAGGAPFWIPDEQWLERFGGWDGVRVVPDGTLAALDRPPVPGTLLREFSDPRIYLIASGTRRWVRSRTVLAGLGGLPTVRIVPDDALESIPLGPALPPVLPSAEVPDVREMLRDQAGTAVRDAGFVPAFTGTNRSDSWVVSQSPNAGEMLEGASTVTMQLRRGPIF